MIFFPFSSNAYHSVMGSFKNFVIDSVVSFAKSPNFANIRTGLIDYYWRIRSAYEVLRFTEAVFAVDDPGV
jgi:hypothetical protein